MNLELIKLNPDNKDRKYFERINDEAFPPSERMSFGEIFDFASDTDTDVLGIYDDRNPVGFAVLFQLRHNKFNLVILTKMTKLNLIMTKLRYIIQLSQNK